MPASPRISVIIPTFNWSSVLAVALEAVRLQTLQDFEVIVVGDGCTDDSESVVASFGDRRFHWINLERNHGSQWAANNRGLEQARAPYVAYLGHDDIWWPTHLQKAVDALDGGADFVTGLALFYGPPGSGVRGASGCLPNGSYGAQLFLPPSAIAHRRDIVERCGPWRSMRESRYSVDNDFVIRIHQTGARMVSTGELTVFKLSAGWRRGSYRIRDASEQRHYLNRMRVEGEAFRVRELTTALIAAATHRFTTLEMPLAADHGALPGARLRWAFKGTRPPAQPIRALTQAERLYPPDESANFEWHAWEENPHGRFRWSGPSVTSTIVLPVAAPARSVVTLQVVNQIADTTLRTARLSLHGDDLAMAVAPQPDGTWLWSGAIEAASDADRPLELTLHVEHTWRPFDRGLNEDRRWLGLAIGWIEIRPEPPGAGTQDAEMPAQSSD